MSFAPSPPFATAANAPTTFFDEVLSADHPGFVFHIPPGPFQSKRTDVLHLAGAEVTVIFQAPSPTGLVDVPVLRYSAVAGPLPAVKVRCAAGCRCSARIGATSLDASQVCPPQRPPHPNGWRLMEVQATSDPEWWVWLLVGLGVGLFVVILIVVVAIVLYKRRQHQKSLPMLDHAEMSSDQGVTAFWPTNDPFCTPTEMGLVAYNSSAPLTTPRRGLDVYFYYSPASTIFDRSPASEPSEYAEYVVGESVVFPPIEPIASTAYSYSIPSTVRSHAVSPKTDATSARSAFDLPNSRYQIPMTSRIQEVPAHAAMCAVPPYDV
eukprot:EG_transcript_10337